MAGINVDYGFYVEDYFGSSIPSDAFPGWGRDAEGFVNRITFGRIHKYELRPDDLVSVQMAICAVAEVFANADQHSGIKSENNDGYSVTYEDITASTTNAKATEAADLYLCDTTLRNRCVNYDY